MLQQKVRIALKHIESLSYNFDKPNQLEEVLRLTEQLETTVRDMAPSDSGLVIRPSLNTTVTARKVKLKYKQYKTFNITFSYACIHGVRYETEFM